MQTQWHCTAGPMGGSSHTGLNYLVLFAFLDRMKLADDDYEDLLCDVQTLERAALEAMAAKD